MLHTSVSPPLSPPQVSPGHVVGLVSQDVRRFKDALFYWHNVVVGPLEMMLVSVPRAGEGETAEGGARRDGGHGSWFVLPRGTYRRNFPPLLPPHERGVVFRTGPWQDPAAVLLSPPLLPCLRPADPTSRRNAPVGLPHDLPRPGRGAGPRGHLNSDAAHADAGVSWGQGLVSRDTGGGVEGGREQEGQRMTNGP